MDVHKLFPRKLQRMLTKGIETHFPVTKGRRSRKCNANPLLQHTRFCTIIIYFHSARQCCLCLYDYDICLAHYKTSKYLIIIIIISSIVIVTVTVKGGCSFRIAIHS